MKTHTTPTGIELLMPQVPKDATGIKLSWKKVIDFSEYWLEYRLEKKTNIKLKNFDTHRVQLTILGTCWREGDKLVCDFNSENYFGYHEGNAPLFMCRHHNLNGLLRSEGITIPEGFKRVIIKVY